MAGVGESVGVGTGVSVGAAVGNWVAVGAGSVGVGVAVGVVQAKNRTEITESANSRSNSGTPSCGENAGYRAKLAITLRCHYKRGRVGAPSFRSPNGLR